MEFVLRQREFRAGEFRVGFQSCDYTVAGEPDAGQCTRNARSFVAAESVVGVIGPFLSGCAELQIPIVSRTAAGPLAMISPANTSSGLTRGPAALPLYPDGVRSYTRVVTHDEAQGAAAAHIAQRFGARRVAVVAQRGIDDPYVAQLTPSFRATARSLGLEERTFDWPRQERYTELAASIAAFRPEAVYLVGLPEGNADTLIRDLKAALPDVMIITPDSFAAEDMARELGPIGDGLITTVPGVPTSELPPAGQRFLRESGAKIVGTGTGTAGSRPGDRSAPGRDRPFGRNPCIGRGRALRDARSRTGSSAPSRSTGSATSIRRRSACTATRTGRSSSTASSVRRSTRRVASACRRARRRDRRSEA